jgi:hypothetical protein
MSQFIPFAVYVKRSTFAAMTTLACLACSMPIAARAQDQVPPAEPPNQQSDAEAAPPAPPETSETGPVTVQENLPWQPGLGQPIRQPQPAPAQSSHPQSAPQQSAPPAGPLAPPFGTGIPNPAAPIHGARPLNAQAPSAIPDPAAGPQQATPDGLVLDSGNQTPVIPAALLLPDPQPAGAGLTGNQQDTEGASAQDTGTSSVIEGLDGLPNSAGQIWRSYDISPYTYNVRGEANPEKAVIDWIVKETGADLWFSEPLGVLSVSRNQLHVYHTPEIQERVRQIVDRFIQSRGAPLVFGMRLVTIASPNWRSAALTIMQPIPIESPGVEGWLMTRENAALLAGQLRVRADYQERNNADLVVTDGQKYTLAQRRPIEFLRTLAWVNQGAGYYQPIRDKVDEGYTIEFSALSSVGGDTIEAIIGCDIDQIERLQPVPVQLPGAGGQVQSAELQIPQMSSWRVNERFRWPSDQVLVLSCGVVATPGPQRQALLGIPSLLNDSRGRADALMFIEYKGRAAMNAATPAGASPAASAATTTGQMLPIEPRR